MAFPIALAIQLASFLGPKVVSWVAGDDAGDVAQEVVNMAEKVTGTDTAEDAVKAIQADPALMLKFQQEGRENEAKLEQMYLADRQDARNRDLEIRKLGVTNKRADIMVLGCFASLVAVITMVWQLSATMPPELLGFFSTVTGYLLKMLGDAFAFEFGSSRGSKEKSVLMARGEGR